MAAQMTAASAATFTIRCGGLYRTPSDPHYARKKRKEPPTPFTFVRPSNGTGAASGVRETSSAEPPSAKRPALSYMEMKKIKERQQFFERPKLPLTVLDTDPRFDIHACDHYFSFERQDTTGKLSEQRQRGSTWHEGRVRVVTGSRLIGVLMLFGYDQLYENWYQTYQPKSPVLAELAARRTPEEVEQQNECMAWGTFREIDAMASFLKHVAVPQDLTVMEAPLKPIRFTPLMMDVVKETLAADPEAGERKWKKDADEQIWNTCMRVSPDGIGYERKTRIKFAIEFKCGYGLRMPKVYDEAKWYYYPQMQLHMMTDPEIKYCFFVSWSPTVMRVWRVARDPDFWTLALPFIVRFHDLGLKNCPPTPTRVPEMFRVTKVSNYCKKKIKEAKLVGEFPSVYSNHRTEDLERLEALKWLPPPQPPASPASTGASSVPPTETTETSTA